ncbi:MAG: YbhB/YbcL family Raf kinase inhibitor-like protein, partial [Myxococcales bacterium]
MKLWSDSIENGGRIAERYALGRPHPKDHVQLSDNVSPHLAWSELPAGTRSLVLICHDRDVPSQGDRVNKEGMRVPWELPRVDFFHWVLVDLAPDAAPLAEGEFSRGVTPKGKPGPAAPRGTRQGLNGYTDWFAGNADMGGMWFGYDGPGPPWNDERLHHYVFTLYALDVPRCPVEGTFTGADVRRAITGHVLGQAAFTGSYAIYPEAR